MVFQHYYVGPKATSTGKNDSGIGQSRNRSSTITRERHEYAWLYEVILQRRVVKDNGGNEVSRYWARWKVYEDASKEPDGEQQWSKAKELRETTGNAEDETVGTQNYKLDAILGPRVAKENPGNAVTRYSLNKVVYRQDTTDNWESWTRPRLKTRPRDYETVTRENK